MSLIAFLTNAPLVIALVAGLVAGMPQQVRNNVTIVPIAPRPTVRNGVTILPIEPVPIVRHNVTILPIWPEPTTSTVTTHWTAEPTFPYPIRTIVGTETIIWTAVVPISGEPTTKGEFVTTQVTPSKATSTEPATKDLNIVTTLATSSIATSTEPATKDLNIVTTLAASTSTGKPKKWFDDNFHWPGWPITTSTKYPISTADASVACRPTMC